jgi:UDP-N-acetyl-alpha-D-muramoyl-L-alanyl-L-glutamate epimerase
MKVFYFEKYSYDPEEGVARFHYSYDREVYFEEILEFKSEVAESVLFHLHLALGISYYKAYLAPEIKVKSGQLNREMAEFWDTTYTKGLGEFFYQNKIDYRGLVRFPYSDKDVELAGEIGVQDRALVPLGGGKDSLVTAGILQEKGIDFDAYTLGTHPIIDSQIKCMNRKHFTVKRTLDKSLFDLPEALNGHVPISMIYAFTALLGGYKYIVLSNERSSNYGNTEYLGEEVNHQWSKSLEFEKMFNKYVRKFVAKDVYYFSLLRPMYEIKIAEKFATMERHLNMFTSCNRNFKITEEAPEKWCRKCAKCAFVFAILAPFVEKEKLVTAFGGNLFAGAELLEVYEELLGVSKMKPFDCVGTPEEVRKAMEMARSKYEDDVIIKRFVELNLPPVETDLFSISNEHIIPDGF